MIVSKPKNTDEYIANFPVEIQLVLEEVRATIKTAAPNATEAMSYSMPAFKDNGLLVWFAAHTKHIGFYPRASAIEKFYDKLISYTFSKGAIQFPLTAPMPLALITEIVKYRVEENKNRINKRKVF